MGPAQGRPLGKKRNATGPGERSWGECVSVILVFFSPAAWHLKQTEVKGDVALKIHFHRPSSPCPACTQVQELPSPRWCPHLSVRFKVHLQTLWYLCNEESQCKALSFRKLTCSHAQHPWHIPTQLKTVLLSGTPRHFKKTVSSFHALLITGH